MRSIRKALFVSALLVSSARASLVIDVAAGEQDVTIFGADADDEMTQWSGIVTGDLNADGNADLVVGASQSAGFVNAHPDAGEVHVFFGPFLPGSFDLRTRPGDLTIYGATGGDLLGVGLSIGDVSGDGIADLVMGARYSARPGGLIEAGKVFVLFGPLAGGVRHLASGADAVVLGARRGDELGFSTAVADLNADGSGDLIVASRRADGPGGTRGAAGEVGVLFGPLATATVRDLALAPADFVVQGADDNETLGETVAVGDVNGDALPDLMLGVTGADRDDPVFGHDTAVGRVDVFLSPVASGAVVDLAMTPGDVRVLGPRISSYRLGSALMSADVDGDGLGDLVMGAEHASSSGVVRGGVHVLLGPLAAGSSVDLETSAADVSVLGPTMSVQTRFGESVTAVDLNGDGIDDLAIGAPYANGPVAARQWCGETHVIRGPLSRGAIRDLATAPADVVIHGAEIGDHVGDELASADLDGDGLRDLFAGAFGSDGPANTREDAGEAYAFFLGNGNSPPSSDAGPDQLVSCQTAHLAGSGTDPDGDVLAPLWSSSCLDAIFMPGPDVFAPEVSVSALCGSTCSFTLVVDDGHGATASDTTVITFADREPPVIIEGSAGTRCLWPPSHRMTCFSLLDWTPEAVDNCGHPVALRFTSCISDQPDDATADGRTSGDCEIAPDGRSFCVRSERQGTGQPGRTYLVEMVATDACGNEGAPTVTGSVRVPHDLREAQRKGCAPP